MIDSPVQIAEGCRTIEWKSLHRCPTLIRTTQIATKPNTYENLQNTYEMVLNTYELL